MNEKTKMCDERIAAVKLAIAKEVELLKQKRERITKLKQDLTRLECEKEQIYADEFLQIANESGISTEEHRRELLRLVKKSVAAIVGSTPTTDFSSSDGHISATVGGAKSGNV
jgi:hypothetical protein